MCGILCLFGCLTVCQCQNCVARRVVFFPPPCSYEVEERVEADPNAADGSGEKRKQVIWLRDGEQRVQPYASKNVSLDMVESRAGTIAMLNIRFPRAKSTILFSHGNATDIGHMRDHLLDMAIALKCNISCYDYTGYGMSKGKATVQGVYDNAMAAYDYLLRTYDLRDEDIVLYGQSLGSGPSTYLAAKFPVRGLVLHSPISSGCRVIKKINHTPWFDIFPNIDVVKEVQSPVFVIHGTEDVEIPPHHGEAIYANAPRPYNLWLVPGADHNNIEVMHRDQWKAEVKAFLASLKGGE